MKAEVTTSIKTAAAFLKRGEPVAIPTETVYGLAANAFNQDAVKKIFEAKRRPSFDPLIVHTSDSSRISSFAYFTNKNAKLLGEAFWPGPLTLVLPKKEIIPEEVTAGLPTVGIRIPNHRLTLKLLSTLDFPLAAPSANPFGYVSPTSAQHVMAQLGDRIACILDGGQCKVGLESTIVGFPDGKPTIYRYGGLEVEQIEKVVGEVDVSINASSNPLAPGMVKKHYSPQKEIILGDPEKIAPTLDQPFAILSFAKNYEALGAGEVFTLSQKGDLNEAAYRLFQGLRFLDSLEVEVIIAEPVPDRGLGKSINDRLKRAGAK